MTDQTADIKDSGARIDKVWVAIAVMLLGVWLIDPDALWGVLADTAKALSSTGIFIAFAVAMVAFLKATGAEGIVAEAFKGSPARMVILAAFVGGLAPFCSCEVIPFVAALLAMGVPLAAVMAFWLASPIMDPPMFIITTSALGMDFAFAKTIGAVGFGLLGGFGVMALGRSALFADPLRQDAQQGGCGCGTNPFTGKPIWAFWRETERMQTFVKTAWDNAFFLFKWLTLAYVVEASTT